MKSPITGSEMKVKNEIRQLTFRKDVFDVNSLFYHCDESGEKFTSDELDRINLLQVHNQYRDCLLYTSPSPRDQRGSRMPSSA